MLWNIGTGKNNNDATFPIPSNDVVSVRRFIALFFNGSVASNLIRKGTILRLNNI